MENNDEEEIEASTQMGEEEIVKLKEQEKDAENLHIMDQFGLKYPSMNWKVFKYLKPFKL